MHIAKIALLYLCLVAFDTQTTGRMLSAKFVVMLDTPLDGPGISIEEKAAIRELTILRASSVHEPRRISSRTFPHSGSFKNRMFSSSST